MTNQNLFTAQDASGNLIYVDVPPSPAGLHYILNGGVGGTEIAVEFAQIEQEEGAL